MHESKHYHRNNGFEIKSSKVKVELPYKEIHLQTSHCTKRNEDWGPRPKQRYTPTYEMDTRTDTERVEQDFSSLDRQVVLLLFARFQTR